MCASDRLAEPMFGHAGASWPLDLEADPAITAARYLQHRLIVAAREDLGEDATATDFVRRLGDGFSDKKVQRHLSGHPLRLDELLHWCHALDIDPGALVGRGLADATLSLPPLYARHRLSRPGTPPRLEASNVDIDWQAVVDGLLAAIADAPVEPGLEASVESASHFVTSDVVRHHLRRDLVLRREVNSALIKPLRSGFELLGPQGRTVQALAATADEGEPWDAVRAALTAPSSDLLVLCLGRTASALSEQELPGLVTAAVKTVYVVPDSVYEAASVPLTDAPVEWQVRGAGAAAALRLLVLEHKS